MLNRPIEKFWLNIFYVFSAITLACAFLSIYFEEYLLMLIPAACWLWPISVGTAARCRPRLSATRIFQPRRTVESGAGACETMRPSGTEAL